VNIGEIARRAGVSRSTVSYALSGKRPIGESTRRRVLAVIDEVDYRPSATARALAAGSTRTIGLVVPPLHHHLSIDQLQFVGAVAEAASERDYDILLSPSGDERERAFDRLVGERRVDGLILMETQVDDPKVVELINSGFPFVTIGRAGRDRQHSWVDLDYAGLVRQAVVELHRLGHRHLGLVNRPQELLDRGYGPALRAEQSFAKAVAKVGGHGVSACCEDTDDDAARCLGELLARDRRLTAIVSINERSLFGLVRAASARGLPVGTRLAVMAIAPDRVAAPSDPPITAANVPANEMGRAAVDALLDHLRDPAQPLARVLMRPPFTDRGSARRRATRAQ
jgi:DNA-binding LacI/PurR family transcriptional regulator